MKAKNRYIKRSKVSEAKFRQILRLFCLDVDATRVSLQTNIDRKTINRLFMLFRKRIVLLCEYGDEFSGEVEVDESYFGARRVRGKRGRGAKGKVPVVGILKRGGKVYCQPIKKCTKEELLPVIRGKIIEESTIYTDGWKSYDGLVLNGYQHYRIYHSRNEFARGKNHINGIESFWSYAKRRMSKFNGLSKKYFLLHLKESEFRWNHKNHEGMYKYLLKNFRKNPL